MIKVNKTTIRTEYVSCDLCGSDTCSQLYKMPDLRYWTTDQEYSIVQCTNCKHRYINPRPVIDDLKKCYPDEYYNLRGQDITKQRARYSKQSSYFKNLPPGRFLDIGCAKGAFCETMIELGWDCYGMDFFEQPENDLPKGLKFHSGQLEEIAYQDNYFDVISAWGVFEHLISPRIYFIEASRILKPGGFFVIMVPNGNSLWSRFAYKDDIPRHLHFFTKKSIKKYAEVANLNILRIKFNNNVYSRPATGKDVFRINLLKWAGVPWNKINSPQAELYLKLISSLGSVMGRALIYPKIEEFLKQSGIMIIHFTKI